MRFKEYVEIREALEEMKVGSLGGGVLAGMLALGGLASGGESPSPTPKDAPASVGEALPKKAPPRMLGPKELMSRPDYKEMVQRLKDEGKYYHPNTVKELRDKAEKGDAWAVRELPWPKEHRLHKMGRPYFRNDKPHPEGLFPHSGL